MPETDNIVKTEENPATSRLSADLELLKDERFLIQENPLNLVEYEFLTIKTKSDKLTKLKLNTVQKIILAFIKQCQEEKKPVRFLILKARQMGASTLIEAVIYSYVSQSEGVNALVVADDIKGSNYIFEMQKLFHEKLDAHLKPKIKHSNEKKLEFDGIHSQVLVDTAENPNVGHKFTLRYFHGTEVARFPDLERVMVGVSQAVPNSPNTMIVLESTANGVGNGFYTRWCEAVEGNSDWKAIFIPWFELPEYSMPLEASSGVLYPVGGLKGDKKKFTDDEKKLKERFNLSDEQMNWRRWCIINNCGGNLNTYMEQYPSTWQESFIMSGNLYFDKDALLEEERKRDEIKKKGFPRIGNIVKFEGKFTFRECEEGRFRLYEQPIKQDQYCVGADCAEGLPHGDDQAAVVLNKKSNKVAMAYNSQCDSDEFSEDLILMGNFYNSAMIAPESKGYGATVCKKVYHNYGNVFRKIRDKSGSMDVTDDLGYNTNSSTRPQMLNQLKEELAEGALDVLDGVILSQMRTFVYNPKKHRPEADAGKKDDMVFALSIALMVRHYYPNFVREEGRSLINSLYGVAPKPNQGLGFKKG